MSMTMMKPDQAVTRSRAGEKMEEKFEFRVIFAVVLMLFSVGALVQMFVPRPWRAAGAELSSIKGVMAAARSASKFAFMG